ncbi:Low temperature viability protein, partial [Mytilinidion resinicola]
MVFAETAAPNTRVWNSGFPSSSAGSQYSSASTRSKIKSRGDLESEFGLDVRQNEGEAANYGILYDDTEYDYMQHMKDLGSTGEAYFVEAPQKKEKGKDKVSLADALRAVSIDDRQSDAGVSVSSSISRDARDLFGEDLAPSEFVRKTTYQDQQNVPDALAGFQPDMDPRLREVLEALEDEAYVDDEEDIFAELASDEVVNDPRAWKVGGWDVFEGNDDYSSYPDEEDEGWQTDDTIKASSPKSNHKKASKAPTDIADLPAPDAAPELVGEGDDTWMHEFNKFKKDGKAPKASKPVPSDLQSSVLTGASALTAGGRHKKRKGARTSTTNYSMTSSALHRTEGLSLLDQRFDKIEEAYADNDGDNDFPADDESMMSGTSKMSGMSKISAYSGVSGTSEAPQLRGDFDNILDDFLGGHSMAGKKRIKKMGYQSGLEQLEEVRKGLGPARIKTQKGGSLKT